MNWENIFHWEKCSFELIGNSAHTAEYFSLRKGPEYVCRVLNTFVEY